MKIERFITIQDTKIPAAYGDSRLPPEGVDNAGFGRGLLFKGKIIASLGDGRVQLAINERIVSAESRLPLQPGMELWLEVKNSGRNIFLAPAPKKGAAQELLKLVLSDSPAVKKTIQGLARYEIVSESHLSHDEIARFGPIFRLFSTLAFGTDQNLAKLLGMLPHFSGAASVGKSLHPPFNTMLAGFLDVLKNSNSFETLRHIIEAAGLEKFLEYAKILEQLNGHSSHPGEPPFYLFPCFFAAGAGWGQWLFSLENDDDSVEQERGGAAILQFFLDMSRLGSVHLRVRVGKDMLQGGFLVENKKVAEHIQGRLPMLQATFAGLGFIKSEFSCGVATHSLTREFREAIQETARLQGVALLDVTV